MNLRLILLAFCIFILGSTATAQDKEYETIFSKRAKRKSPNFRLYGEIINTYNPILKNNNAYHLFGDGVGFGLTYKKKYSMGLGFYGIGKIPEDLIEKNTTDDVTVKAYQFGLSFTYIPKAQKALHFAYNFYAGGLSLHELRLHGEENFDLSKAVGFFVNPNIKLEANLISWVSVNVGLGYRIIGGKSAFDVNINRDINGPALSLGFKFQKLR